MYYSQVGFAVFSSGVIGSFVVLLVVFNVDVPGRFSVVISVVITSVVVGVVNFVVDFMVVVKVVGFTVVVSAVEASAVLAVVDDSVVVGDFSVVVAVLSCGFCDTGANMELETDTLTEDEGRILPTELEVAFETAISTADETLTTGVAARFCVATVT